MTFVPPAIQGYITLPVTTNPNTIQQQALAAIAAALPGWTPREGHIEVILLEQFAAMVAESAQVAASVPLSIFSYFGGLVGINPNTGSYATATTTWVMRDAAGYTVPAGTLVGYTVLGNQVYTFQTTSSFTVQAGETTAFDIDIQAVNSGTVYNSLAPGPLMMISSLAFVQSVTSVTTTAGGADPESQNAYLNRLSAELQLLAPRPIIPSDFAALSTSIAGVYRALAINGLSPGRSFGATTVTNGSPIITSANANFTTADVGRTVSDTSTLAVPGGTTILSVPNTTVAAASGGQSLPQATINVIDASTFPASGTAVLPLTANSFTVVTYTGKTATTLTGCTGGSGTLATGMPIYCGSQATLSLNATGNNGVGGDNITLGDLANQERTIAVCGVDVDGDALSPEISSALQTYLLAKREVNFVVNMLSPTFNPIDVQWKGYCVPGANPTQVQDAANQALADYLSPANWGGGDQTPPIWDQSSNVVRYNAIMALLGSISGMQYIATLTIGLHGSPLGTTDITLNGDAPLTEVGFIAGSVLQGT